VFAAVHNIQKESDFQKKNAKIIMPSLTVSKSKKIVVF
jgi:hypothetical protein